MPDEPQKKYSGQLAVRGTVGNNHELLRPVEHVKDTITLKHKVERTEKPALSPAEVKDVADNVPRSQLSSHD